LQTKTGLSADDRIRREVDYYSRLAKPFACLIVTLIGVPIGAHTGRRGALAGIMTALGLFFVFYALQLTGQALGKNQLLSPLLSGWLPVLVFGAASPFFILRMR
jgi:lipopolysaccharide export LptBFGC system permease protein LptF